MGGKTIVIWHVTDPWAVVLAGALVEAQGVRGFRKSLAQSCWLDALIVSHHNSLDAACCSGKHNPGKAGTALPCFLSSSWAPPTKPSASFTCAHRARRRAALPHRGAAKGGTPAGELGLWTFPGAMSQCKGGGNRIYPSPWPRLAVPPFRLWQRRCQPAPAPARLAGTRCRCFPSSIAARCAQQSVPISTRAWKKRRKLIF